MQSNQFPVAENQVPAIKYASSTADKFVLRMPDGMRSRIEALARDRQRSMNSEMIIRLERSLEGTDRVALLELLVQQLSGRIQELEQQAGVSHA